MQPQASLRFLDQMVEKGLLTAEHREAALSRHQRVGGRIEEALIDVNAVDEAALLKFIAGLHRTRFVSTEKLSKAEIDRAALERVPKKLAERLGVCPVVFDV